MGEWLIHDETATVWRVDRGQECDGRTGLTRKDAWV